MSKILSFPFTRPRDQSINIAAIKDSSRKLKAGLIAPSVEDTSRELAGSHTPEPIKSMDDIIRISKHLIANKRYRDNMLFIVGINFGLRVGDLVTLRFADLINDNYAFKDSFAILETKTKNTRKHARNRHITINTAVVDAVVLYLENTPDVKLSDYMFKSESNNGRLKNEPLHRNSPERILKEVVRELGINQKVATHTLRKTFAYHQMVMSGNDPRKLLLLQKMFGHSTSALTLDYIGITGEEIDEAYRKLNLGNEHCNYLVDSRLMENDDSIA